MQLYLKGVSTTVLSKESWWYFLTNIGCRANIDHGCWICTPLTGVSAVETSLLLFIAGLAPYNLVSQSTV